MEALSDHLPDLLRGAGVTLVVSVVTIAIASLLACVLLVARLSGVKLLVSAVRTFTDIFQNIPYVILVFLFYFGLPELGLVLDIYTSTILGLALYSSAYIGEALRTGYLAIPPEQIKCALASGLSAPFIGIRIVLPQAIFLALPAVTNQWVRIIMNSTVLSILGGEDLLDITRVLAAQTFDVFPFYTAGALGYALIVTPTVLLMRYFEFFPRWRRAQFAPATSIERKKVKLVSEL